jgi:hypothetical protein
LGSWRTATVFRMLGLEAHILTFSSSWKCFA